MNDFSDAEYISTYTRAQAIEDGVLADVTTTAKEAGFVVPVAITARVNALCSVGKYSTSGQSYEGRLWDVLWMAFIAARSHKGGGTLYYRVKIGRENHTLKMVSGPGDNFEHVITIMLRGED